MSDHTETPDTFTGLRDDSTKSPGNDQFLEEHSRASGVGGKSVHSHSESRISYYSVGREFYDDGYSDAEDEASIEDRLDFSSLKVQGRERELRRLHEIYNFVSHRGLGRKRNKGETSIAILKGLSGTGKSTVVKQFMEELQEQSRLSPSGGGHVPFYLHGKYDELLGGDPFAAIVEAFNGFATFLHAQDNEDELERIRNVLATELGSEASTLTTVIPSLKTVLSEEILRKGSKENAKNKLKYTFQMFVNAISTETRPVILFLDDLQWCDSESLELIEALLTDVDLRYFMFIGAYRSDEVEPDDELVQCFQRINNVHSLEEMEVVNLPLRVLNLIVQDTLQRAHPKETMPLTKVIFNKTNGNIFHSIQVMEELQRKAVLSFCRLTFQWTWDLEDVDVDNLLSDDLIQAVTEKIINSPPDLQRVLILAAYTRSNIDTHTLEQLTDLNGAPIESKELLRILDLAVLDGLLTNSMGSKFYSFAHDRIQQAAYSMIEPGEARDDFRVRLGFRLYKMGISPDGEDWMLFVAVDHLNALSLLINKEDPMFLIRVNLEVGDRAASVLAYDTAAKFLSMALQFLTKRENPWENHYDITLRIYRAIAEVELYRGHFEIGNGIGQQVIKHARCFDDQLPVRVSLCRAVGREERHMEAFEMSVGILRTLRMLPKTDFGVKVRLVKDLLYLRRYFARKSDPEILHKPLVNNKRLETVMELLAVAAYHAYYSGAMIQFLAATLRLLRLSMEEGFCGHSGVAMMGYCLFRNNLNDMEGASRFSRLAREILTITNARELECLQIFVVAHWVLSWRDMHEDIIELYDRAYKIGMESGDFENGLLSRTAGYHHAFVAGYPLAGLESDYTSLLEKLKLYKLDSVQVMTVEQLLPIPYLRGTAKNALNTEELGKFGPVTNASSENYRLLYGYMARLQLAVYFNKEDFALQILKKFESVPDFDLAFGTKSIRFCFSSLAYATLYRSTGKRGFLRKARKFLKQLKALCKVKGTNSWHRCMLMEAHLQASEGSHGIGAQASYDHAIGAATRSGHGHDAALGAQLAAEYFMSMTDDFRGNRVLTKAKDTLVRQYLVQAKDAYLKWGAVGLVKHLDQTYPRYLGFTSSVDFQSTEDISKDRSGAHDQETDFGLVNLPALPKLVGNNYHDEGKEDVSVLTDQSAWREKPEFVSNPHTSDGDFPAVLEEDAK